MKRPIQHIIEEESRSEFSQILPHTWVKNDFIKDYGKDIHVEIFKNSESTGETFIVQLKATQQLITDNTNSITLKTKTLKYYASLSTSVLLVFYSTKTKQFWAIWANRLMEVFQPKEEQRSIKITLTKENLITKEYFLELERSFDNDIAHKMNLHIEENGELARLMGNRLKAWCSIYFAGSFEINNFTFPYKVQVSIVESSLGIIVKIKARGENITLETIPMSQTSFLYAQLIIENQIEENELELHFAMANYFCEYRPKQTLKLLSLILHRYSGPLKNQSTLHAIADFALDNNLKHELQSLIENSIKQKNSTDFQILNSSLINKSEMLNNYLANLLLAYNSFSEPKLVGAFAYNIGNFYRSRSESYMAVKYFMLAKKSNPEYLSQYYWWNDLAGVLYKSAHYKLAEKFYKRSIELDEKEKNSPLAFALLGDCLFYQSKFDDAYKLYNYYCKLCLIVKDKIPSAEYSFKGTACLYLVEEGYDDLTVNVAASIEEEKLGSQNNMKVHFVRSVKSYPLNYNSWFHLGLITRKEKDYKNSYYSFLIAALLSSNEINLWVECLVSALQLQDNEIATGIYFLMLEILGYASLNKVVIAIQQIPELNIEDKKSITKEFVNLFEIYKEKIENNIYVPPYIEYRIL